jgi:hypothetical protein
MRNGMRSGMEPCPRLPVSHAKVGNFRYCSCCAVPLRSAIPLHYRVSIQRPLVSAYPLVGNFPTYRNALPALPFRQAGSYAAGRRYQPRGKRLGFPLLVGSSLRCQPHTRPNRCHSARIREGASLPVTAHLTQSRPSVCSHRTPQPSLSWTPR